MLKPYLKNDLFEGIIGKEEYLLLNNDCLIDKNSVLIAIHDPDSKPHKKEDIKGFKDVLQIHFWDLEEDVGNYKIITKEQGKIIKDFILKHKDTKFLIHCHAGQSRSAGVAMAVECIVGFKGDKYLYSTSGKSKFNEVKKHSRYSPNYTVYDVIMNS